MISVLPLEILLKVCNYLPASEYFRLRSCNLTITNKLSATVMDLHYTDVNNVTNRYIPGRHRNHD
jgi:hypothetical protein